MKFEITNNLDVSRFVVPIVEKIMTEQSSLWGIALANSRDRKVRSLTSIKPEFKEFYQWAIKEKILTATTASYFSETVEKTLNIKTENILVSDILSFQDKDKKYKWDLRVIVTSITDANNCKVLSLGWDATIILAEGDFAYVETNANPEGSRNPERRPMHKPVTMYNYTQIIRASKAISGTAMKVGQYDFADLKRELREQTLSQFSKDLDWIVCSSIRGKKVIWGNEIRIAGGLLFYALNEFDKDWNVTAASTINVDSTGWAISTQKIDNGFQYFVENWGKANAILVSPTQARKISYLNPDKVNITLIDSSNPRTHWGATQILKSPIDFNWNMIEKIYVDLKLPVDVAIMFNTEALYLIPMEDRAALQTTKEPEGERDEYSMTILWEWTCRFENPKANSYVMTKLNV